MTPNYKSTIVAISVHIEDQNPICGDSNTIVRLDDEGAGEYIVLDQSGNTGAEHGIVKLNPEELPEVWEAMQKLLRQDGVTK